LASTVVLKMLVKLSNLDFEAIFTVQLFYVNFFDQYQTDLWTVWTSTNALEYISVR